MIIAFAPASCAWCTLRPYETAGAGAAGPRMIATIFPRTASAFQSGMSANGGRAHTTLPRTFLAFGKLPASLGLDVPAFSVPVPGTCVTGV
jgi:hypothetical protein